jgi:PAS domain S-box-containing protein
MASSCRGVELVERGHSRLEQVAETALGALAGVMAEASEGFWRLDGHDRLLEVNEAYCRFSGYSQEELRGRSLEELRPLAGREAWIRQHIQGCQAGSTWFQSQQEAKDGRIFDVEIHALRLAERGQAICFVRDITTQTEAKRQLLASEARFRSLLEEAPLAIAMTRGGRFLYVNPGYLTLHGFTCTNELIGTSIFERVLPEDRAAFQDFPDRQTRPGSSFEFRSLRKDGTAFPVSASVRILALSDGPAVLGFIQDIRERARAEQEREGLIRDLQIALAKVKTLRGLIPICSHCKKIRDDKGYWNQLEVYITSNSEAAFTHGVCPECVQDFYSDYIRR